MAESVKIKVIFLLSNFRAGGAETQYANLIKNIDKRRFEPILGLIHYKDNIPSEAFISRFGDVQVKHFFRKNVLDFTVISDVASFSRAHRIDIVQSLLFMDNQIARFAGLIIRRPVITSVRGEIGPLIGAFKMWFEFKAQALSRRIIVNSEWLKGYLVDHGSRLDKIITIHNGIDVDRYKCAEDRRLLRKKYGIPENAPVLTIVARLHPMKDHIAFFEVIKQVKSRYPDLHAIVVGDGGERTRLEQYVKDNNLSRNVVFMGTVSGDLPEIYRITDVLLLTSQWGESFPNVLLEAMSASVPVVASNISAVSEIIVDGENGFMADKKDIRKFSDAVMCILSDEDLRKKFQAAGRETVETFGVQVMVNKYETLYSKLVD